MIFGPFERMLAGRYLRARRQEGFVSVIAGFSLLGIALGVATLIIVMSVMTGFRTHFVAQILGINPHIFVTTSGPIQNFDPLVAKIKQVPGVASVMPTVEGQVLMTSNGYGSLLVVRGLRQEDIASRPVIADHIVKGSLKDLSDDRIAIGIRLAERFNLTVGDKITLISPKITYTPFGSMPRKGTFEIGLIFNVGMYDVDNSVVAMPLDTAQSFFQTGDGATELDVLLNDPENGLATAKQAIAQTLGTQFRVFDWKDQNFAYLNALDTERVTMFIILTLIVIVAAFNIVSSLIMLVKDKGADIAILRTMGATRGMIMRIFFMTGASIGTIGATVGVILGVLFVQNIETLRHWVQAITGTDVFSAALYFFTEIPAVLDWTQVAYVVAMALGFSFLASIIPSWRASRIDPVEALRYE